MVTNAQPRPVSTAAMDTPYQHIQVIINPASGGNRPVLGILNRVFQKHGVRWDVSVTNRQGDGRRLAREAVQAGADLVAAYGGDGTLMEVAGGLVDTGVPLAYLPGGTGNVMAAELGISRRLTRAAALIFDPARRLRPIDLGRIGEWPFLLRASVGFEAVVAAKTSRELKDRFGLLAYGISILGALGEPLTARYQLTLDNHAVEAEGFSLLIANAGSIGRLNLSLSSGIAPDDGWLDVMIISTDVNSMLSMAASVVRLEEYAASLQHWKAREVTVTADPPQRVQVDGDPIGETPVTATVTPGAVQVIVPG